MHTEIERRTMRKVYLRLLPFTFALYLICYLDRANIGFAALTMNRDLGFSSYIYGLGAGAFFWGYFLLEVPSNLILERVGPGAGSRASWCPGVSFRVASLLSEDRYRSSRCGSCWA